MGHTQEAQLELMDTWNWIDCFKKVLATVIT